MIYRTKIELLRAIDEDMKKIVGNVSSHVLEEVIKPTINEKVYDSYSPLVYERLGDAGGFLGSWKISDTELTFKFPHKSFEASIFIDEDEMVVGHPYHESSDGEDRRGIMAEAILFGKDYDYTTSIPDVPMELLPWTQPRDFWTPILEFLETPVMDYYVTEVLDSEKIAYIEK